MVCPTQARKDDPESPRLADISPCFLLDFPSEPSSAGECDLSLDFSA